MAAGIQAVIKLVRKVDRTDKFVRALRAEVWAVVRRAATNIERRVKTTAPYRTGNLRRSYHVQLDREQLRANVGSDPAIAPYAAYVEFGTSTQRAQPHLGPAGHGEAASFQSGIRAAVSKTVAEWSGGKR